MRFVYPLTPKQEKLEVESITEESPDFTTIKSFDLEYDKNITLKHNYKLLKRLSHPLDDISMTVESSFINGEPIQITNAYIKIIEFLKTITFPDVDVISMFDIAGAPGMFVIGTENYLSTIGKKLNWKACSLEGGTALQDEFNLFKQNPTRFIKCDLTKEADVRSCIGEKYFLVTGDVGMEHGYVEVQEMTHRDVEYGQAILALNIVELHGVIFLKMYSYYTKASSLILELISRSFDSSYICKPVGSRILNNESYIVGIGRNNYDVSAYPLTRTIQAKTLFDVSEFDEMRLKYKFDTAMSLLNIILKYHKSISEIKSSIEYKQFYNIFNTVKPIKGNVVKRKMELAFTCLKPIYIGKKEFKPFHIPIDDIKTEIYNMTARCHTQIIPVEIEQNYSAEIIKYVHDSFGISNIKISKDFIAEDNIVFSADITDLGQIDIDSLALMYKSVLIVKPFLLDPRSYKCFIICIEKQTSTVLHSDIPMNMEKILLFAYSYVLNTRYLVNLVSNINNSNESLVNSYKIYVGNLLKIK
jgi:hypothetical protein